MSECIHHWIPVSERLPVKRGPVLKHYVLAVDAKGRMSVGYVFDCSTGEVGWTFAKPIGEPTHWMPLPEAPYGNY